MKLGLIIQNVSNGAQEALQINKENYWARSVEDLRFPVEGLDHFKGTGKTVIFAKFLGTSGYFLAIVKAAPAGSLRPNDLTVAWIHIPALCDISNVEICDVLNRVENAISAPYGIDGNYLNQVFSKEYDENSVQISAVSTIISKSGAGYAVRFYSNSDYTLKELLGNTIAQEEYSNYGGIFFIDAMSGITSKYPTLDFVPKTICTIYPLMPKDGFTPYVYTTAGNVIFNKTIEVPAGKKVEIRWYKQGYSEIPKTFIAKDDNGNCIEAANITPNDYYKEVPRSSFNVCSSDGNPIRDYDIFINGKKCVGDPIQIPHAIYEQGLTLSIYAPGFSEWKKSNVHLAFLLKSRIVMENQLYHYEFKIPAYDGEERLGDARVILDTKKELKSSPIKGYSLDYEVIQEGKDGNNPISYKDDIYYKLKYIVIGVGVCILALLAYAGLEAMDDYEFQFGWPPLVKNATTANTTPDTTDNKEQLPDTQTVEDYTGAVNTDSINAIAYLDANSMWHKDSIDAYVTTRGMFDELNEFNGEALKQRYSAKLGASQKFTEVVEALDKNSRNGYDPHIGKENRGGNYNTPTDKGINVKNYIDWLSKRHDPIPNGPQTDRKPIKPQTSNNISGKQSAPSGSKKDKDNRDILPN